MIDETYSAFVQGFMPTLARGRRSRRADHRDHRRPGADLIAARFTLTGEHLAAYVGT